MGIREDSTWSDPELGCCKATDTFWRCGAGMGGAGVQAEWQGHCAQAARVQAAGQTAVVSAGAAAAECPGEVMAR